MYTRYVWKQFSVGQKYFYWNIDYQYAKRQEVFYALFEWAALPNSKVVVIGESDLHILHIGATSL